MSWTQPQDIKAQVARLWKSGAILASLVTGDALFPKRLALKKPRSADLSDRFAEVKAWIAALDHGQSAGYRIVWKEVHHRVIGKNALPAELWVDSLEGALGLIHKKQEAARFSRLLHQTRARRPELLPWLARRPLKALGEHDAWPLFLDVATWLMVHPRPGIFLRQMDLPGVHTKFIEAHRGLLAELLDLCLPREAVDHTATGTSGFCRRYGFLDKPARIRFRLLDPALALFPWGTDQDIALTASDFAGLSLPVDRVFITENEVNFLAFPPAPKSMVVFGKGYGFEMLKPAHWLTACRVFYWGDLDTHGFAILDQLRATLPHAVSFLMDKETLARHRELWGQEARPETRDLHRLSSHETELYNALRQGTYGEQVRLEQERIAFGWLRKTLGGIMDGQAGCS